MLQGICTFILRSLGWTLDIDWPDTRKYVVIVYPHTSNWDFLLGVCAAKALKLEAHYIAKHTLFRKPYGWFFRALGGIPVDRRRKASLARQIAERFDEADEFVLGLAPEGTRSKTDHWKSGFYHIARAAEVPIVMAYFDYPNKKIGMGGSFYPGEDIEESYEQIRLFFKGRQGKNPGQESLIQPRTR
jgi:1-acyl-sn-glycerol-3-phosphate acyltransferase